MREDIETIKRFLASTHGFEFEGWGWISRVVGEVPDGEHIIPLGVDGIPTKVSVREGRIYIGDAQPDAS